jgi:hypothetical protein
MIEPAFAERETAAHLREHYFSMAEGAGFGHEYFSAEKLRDPGSVPVAPAPFLSRPDKKIR